MCIEIAITFQGWLAADFQKERSRHMVNARKVSRAVDVFHKTKEARDLKKEKDEILAVKRVSSKISRDVRKFWLKINKVIAFKQKAESDDIRQKVLQRTRLLTALIIRFDANFHWVFYCHILIGHGQTFSVLSETNGAVHKYARE